MEDINEQEKECPVKRTINLFQGKSTLKELENQGLVLRKQFNEIPPHVEYSLTESAKELDQVFQAMRDWGNKYL